MKAHRAMLIGLPTDKCDVNHIRRLMALTNLAYHNFEVWEPNIPKTIQYHLYGFKNYMGSLVFGTTPKKWFAEVWVPLGTMSLGCARSVGTSLVILSKFKCPAGSLKG